MIPGISMMAWPAVKAPSTCAPSGSSKPSPWPAAPNPRRLEQASLIFEKMLGYANHLGLYAEETGVRGEALGNFPQAFTHLSLISAAYNLDLAMAKRARF